MFETLNDLEHRVLDLIKKYTTLKSEHQNGLAQYESLKNAHQDLLSRIPSLQTLQTQIAEMTAMKAHNSQLLSERQQTQASLAEKQQSLDTLTLAQQRLSAENQQLKDEVAQLRGNMHSAETRLAEMLSNLSQEPAPEKTEPTPAHAASAATENLDPFAELIDDLSESQASRANVTPQAASAPQSYDTTTPNKPVAMTFTAPTFQLP